MGQSQQEAKQPTKVVEREVVVPEKQEHSIVQAPLERRAGETFLSATKRAQPGVQTTITPGTTQRVREEVPLTDDEKRQLQAREFLAFFESDAFRKADKTRR